MNQLQLLNFFASLTICVSFFLLLFLDFYWSRFWQHYKLKFNFKILFHQSSFPFYKKIRRLKKKRQILIFVCFLISLVLDYFIYFNILKWLSFIPKLFPSYILFTFAIPVLLLCIFSQLIILFISYLLKKLELTILSFGKNLSKNIENTATYLKIGFHLFKIIFISSIANLIK